tara:strand:+ start:916 stop:2769 length:1854 start_codon:yes stop_codon:yes gene_type:complete
MTKLVVVDGIDNTKSISSYSDKEFNELRNEVFWRTGRGNTIDISLYDLCKFLKRKGFGKYISTQQRTEKDSLVRWSGKILQIHNIKSIKDFIIDYFDKSNPELFYKDNPYSVKYEEDDMDFYWSKTDLMNRLFRNNIFKEENIPSLNEFNIDNPKLFMDEKDVVFIRFQDKLVKVTDDKIEECDYDILGDESVWETQLISKPFNNVDTSGEGAFEKFMKMTCMDLNGNNSDEWTENYSLNEERWKSLKTTYGYMISQFKNPELAKCVIFIDKDTREDVSNGRTGKSVIMNSVEHWKSFIKEDGKNREVTSGNHRLSQVKLDTKFTHIQDLFEGFNFQELYNPIADNLTINPKNQSPFTIPFEHSPKFGITTNFISHDSDISTRGRQHFVEFGGYWRTAMNNGESPSDNKHLGKLLFGKDFTDKDWNEFYNFGFKCVQEFLKYGLIECEMGDLTRKMLQKEIEGSSDTGEFDWILSWIENDRVSDGADKLPGIKIDDLYSKFQRQFSSHIMMNGGQSYKKKFVKSIYTICEKLGYEYNGHKRHLGDTPTDRRHLKKNNQTGKNDEMLIITENPRFKGSLKTTQKSTHHGEKTPKIVENSKELTHSDDNGEVLEDLFYD